MLGAKEVKKYKLDLLRRITARVDGFSQTCGECEAFKQDVTSLLGEMSMLVQMPSRQGLRNHMKAVNGMVEHLKKVHKLVDKGYYLGMSIGIGLALGGVIGGVLGAILDSPAIGTAIGVALGAAVGAYLDRKAREEGRVI